MLNVKNYTEDSIEPISLEILSEQEVIQLLLRESFLEMSEEIGKKGINNGATASVVFIRNNYLYTANVGDTRVVKIDENGFKRLTIDHRGVDESEHRRIREVGGFVAGGRVNGVVAVSRALGDNFLEPMVIADPYTTCTQLTDKDLSIILACDGVWDYTKEDVAVKIVKEEKDPRVASSKLRKFSYDSGSTDNITCCVIKFEKN